ncbi:MAG TPA: hypothetical protein VEB22_01245, partial [Phycisphaerales bacterium]|nr:hypothetical protein [Phycisphaerales bacterium]
VGTTRVFQAAFTPMATETTGYPLTITNVVGTPVATATHYGTTAPTLGRSRLVFSSASVADTVRVSSVDELGDLESDSAGNQFVGWTSEYVPTGSAVWGVRAGSDASSYAIAVNYSGGVVREGSTAGSGTVLFTLDPAKVYGICFSGNINDRSARFYAFNLSDDFRRVPLIRSANLTTAWPTGPKGVMSAVYVFGATVPEASTMIAGRTFGLMVGDSYNSTYCNTRGTAVLNLTAATGTTTGTLTETATGATLTSTTTTTSGGVGNVVGSNASPYLLGGGAVTYAGGGTATGGAIEFKNTIICTNNNLGFHVAHGAENHFIPNAYRPGKPVSTDIPDVTYQWSIGRSGLRIEDLSKGTIDACSTLRGACVTVLGSFAHNSMASITAANTATTLADWGSKVRSLRDACLTGGNTVIWPSGVFNTSFYTASGVAAGYFSLAGAEQFMAGTHAEIIKDVLGKPGRLYAYNFYPESNACFVGAVDNIHIAGNTEGARYYVSRLFGNVPGGFTSGSLRRYNPRRRPGRRPTRRLVTAPRQRIAA